MGNFTLEHSTKPKMPQLIDWNSTYVNNLQTWPAAYYLLPSRPSYTHAQIAADTGMLAVTA